MARTSGIKRLAKPRYAAIFQAIRNLSGTAAHYQSSGNQTVNPPSCQEAGPTLDRIVDYIIHDNGKHRIWGNNPRSKVRLDVREKLTSSSFGRNSWGYTLPVYCTERCAGNFTGHYVLTEEGTAWLEKRSKLV